jgi:hypothetical protein
MLGAFVIGTFAGCIEDVKIPANKFNFITKPSIPIVLLAYSSFFLAQRLNDGNVFEIVPLLASNFGYRLA